MSDFFDSIKNKADQVKDNFLDKLGLLRGDWPQTSAQPPFGKPGFLPPQLISPTLKMKKSKPDKKEDEIDEEETPTERKDGEYTYTDWLGYKITENSQYKLSTPLMTKDRFNLSVNLPKDRDARKTDPYSIRDTLILYNDSTQDYFKHSLQVINNLNSDFPETQPLRKGEGSTSRLYNFMNNVKTTPYENNDPVIFGFEIIIDAVSSPLLNGSVIDFLKDLLEEISAALGGINDFQLYTEKNTIQIIDAKYLETSDDPNGSKSSKFKFDLLGLKSICRDVRINSRVYSEQSSMIAIGAAASGDNKNLGDISFVDASNMLRILVFYKDFLQVVFLDNTLSANGETVSFDKIGFQQAQLVCSSHIGNFNN
jgi:hypothetical protein